MSAPEIVTTTDPAAEAGAAEQIEADGTITAAGMIISRFAKEGEERYALEVKVQRSDTNEIVSIELDLEMDDKTDSKGRPFCPFETTVKTLRGLGYKFGDDLSQVDTLVGVNAHITNKPKWVKGRLYDNWKFSRTTTFLDPEEQKNRFQQLMEQYRAKRAGVAPVQTAPAATATPAASKPSPFAAPAATAPAAAPAAAPAPKKNPFA